MTDTHHTDDQPLDPTPTPHFNASCRARASGIGDFVDCLMRPAPGCKHALSFGYGIFCRHPERAGIVAQTEQNPPE